MKTVIPGVEGGRQSMKTRKWYGWLALVGLAASVTAWAIAQAPAPAPGPKRVYTNRMAFKLPLKVDEKDRPRLKEVQLCVRKGGTGEWVVAQTAPPTQNEFIYRAPEEGEYWFTVVTVDQAGRKNPADLSQEVPGLIVVVDKQPPEVDVHPVTSPFGQPLLRCDVKDLNLDPSRTRVEYLTADQTWQPLASIPDQPNMFRVPDPGAMRGVVRATAADLAGNTVMREINLGPQPTAANTGSGAANVASATDLPGSTARPLSLPKTQPVDTGNVVVPARMESRSDKIASPAMTMPGTLPMTRQFLNNTHAILKYQLDPPGSEASPRIDLYMTRDEGQTWEQVKSAVASRDSQMDVTLPGEGNYGLSLVVAASATEAGTPPAKGDAPDWRVEVDTTKPEAQLQEIHSGVGTEAGTFFITWTASDKNLKPEPIDLDFATKPDGPWMPIAHGLKNDGSYHWVPMRPWSGEFFIRLQATDLAGNMTSCQSAAGDKPRHKARVLGMTPGGSGQ
jgi:hypothetical protein